MPQAADAFSVLAWHARHRRANAGGYGGLEEHPLEAQLERIF
jgi:hypothetical protein